MMTLKIDIAKAFDSINWDFLLECLTSLSLPTVYIHWLKQCFTTTAFSVGLNGRLHGYFYGRLSLCPLTYLALP